MKPMLSVVLVSLAMYVTYSEDSTSSDEMLRNPLVRIINPDNNPNHNHRSTTIQPPLSQPTVNRSWTFAISYIQQRPYVYFDKGKLVGWTVDLIKNICRVAQQTCHVVYLPVSSCSMVEDNTWFPGADLTGGAIDACVWWPITTERENTVDFTTAYQPEKPAQWLVRSTDTSFNAQNLRNKNIGVIRSWHTTKLCLESIGRDEGNFIIYNDKNDALNALRNGFVDAVFSQLAAESGVRLLPELVQCDRGAGIMVKKGSSLPQWWDATFSQYVRCGCYKQMCEESLYQHGATPDCLDLPWSWCSISENRTHCGY